MNTVARRILVGVLIASVAVGALYLTQIPSTPLLHATIGIGITTTAQEAQAHSDGITQDFYYGVPPAPGTALGNALQADGIKEIDAGISSLLGEYECHRIRTIALPPTGANYPGWCQSDTGGSVATEAALLAAIDTQLTTDKANPLVDGYWVLDDWANWDSGSARQVLIDMHAHIKSINPFPAICGFALDVNPPTVSGFLNYGDRVNNYSNQGCDMVGAYAYAAQQTTQRDGTNLDWTMALGLAGLKAALQNAGWTISKTPLIGINQGYSGAYGSLFEPGLSTTQMTQEAGAFCSGGAIAVAWYAYSDPTFGVGTNTPMNTAAITAGIRTSIANCKATWGS